jgi:hypothetical protein
MEKLNPYQSPIVSCLEDESPQSIASHSAEKCPDCNADVTLRMAIKQPTPFRFQCAQCHARFRVRTPFMRLIYVAFCCMIVLLLLVVGVGIRQSGLLILVPGVPLLATVWIALELWTYRYIKRRGTFMPIYDGEFGTPENQGSSER